MDRVQLDEGMASARLRQLRDYWLAARGSRAMPARNDIDPSDVPRLLHHIVLTDVRHDPRELHYRLIGTFVTELAGRDATGKRLDERLDGKRTEEMLWAYHRCIDTLAPIAVRERVLFSQRDWVTVEALMLPMGATGNTIDMILTGVDIVSEENNIPPDDTSYVVRWDVDPA